MTDAQWNFPGADLYDYPDDDFLIGYEAAHKALARWFKRRAKEGDRKWLES